MHLSQAMQIREAIPVDGEGKVEREAVPLRKSASATVHIIYARFTDIRMPVFRNMQRAQVSLARGQQCKFDPSRHILRTLTHFLIDWRIAQYRINRQSRAGASSV